MRSVHRPASIFWSLFAALGLALPPASGRAQDPGEGRARPPVVTNDMPASLALPELPVVAEARALILSGRNADAADRFYAAFQGSGDDRLLYHAGMQRAAAGQHALALRCFEELLARGQVDEKARQHVEGLLAFERGRVAAVRLRLVDGRTGQPVAPSVLSRTRVEGQAALESGAPRRFALTSYGGEVLWLEPGAWIVRIQAPGFRAVELRRSAMFGPSEDTWEVAFVPEQVAVSFHFTPTRALRDARLSLTPTDGSPARPLERPLERGELTMVMPGGAWQLDVTARRHEAHEPLSVVAGLAPVHVRLRPKARPARARGQQFERHEGLLVSLGMVSLVQILAGAGLAVAGGVKQQRVVQRNEALLLDALIEDSTGDADMTPGLAQVEADYATARYHRDLLRSLNLGTAGVALMGGGIGGFVTGLVVSSRTRRWVGWVQLGVGAAVLAGGAAWLNAAVARRDARLAESDPERRITLTQLDPISGKTIGAGLLTGLGAGLVLFGGVALAADAGKKRKERRYGLAPVTAPGFAGLRLTGRF